MQSSPVFPTPACHSTSVSLLSLSTSVCLRNWGNFGSPRVCGHKMHKDLRMESDELEGSVCLCARMWSFVWRDLENGQKMQYDSSGLRTQNIMSGAIILCAIETRRPGCGLEFNQKPVCRR